MAAVEGQNNEHVQIISRKMKVDSTEVTLDFHDTLGTENRGNSIVPAILRDANICFLVYDTNKQNTFDALVQWQHMVKANDRVGNCQFYVIANQMGHEGAQVTAQLPLQTYFCNASTNYELIVQNVIEQAVETKNYVIEEVGQLPKPHTCCP